MADSAKLDPEYECPVCWNPYDPTFRTPKLLQCHHCFCVECLSHLSATTAIRNRLQCPLCRHTTVLHLDQAASDLPSNVDILGQLRPEPPKYGLCAGDVRRLNVFQRPTSVYTLNIAQDSDSLYDVHPMDSWTALPTIPSEESSGHCIQNPHFRMFSYLMVTMVIVSLLLIFSIFWTRRLLWGPG